MYFAFESTSFHGRIKYIYIYIYLCRRARGYVSDDGEDAPRTLQRRERFRGASSEDGRRT
jgi:hypothetical protein